jgi:hypothetical protein
VRHVTFSAEVYNVYSLFLLLFFLARHSYAMRMKNLKRFHPGIASMPVAR